MRDNLAGLIVLALTVVLLSGCTPRDPIGRARVADESRSSAAFPLATGGQMELNTVVGFHIDLGPEWEHTAGAPELGYIYLENEELSCSLALVVATPISDFPHDEEDQAGSVQILERFGPADAGRPRPYLYPTLDGEEVEMLSVVRSNSTGSRMAVAREFGAIDSALMADLACSDETGIEQTFAHEVAARFPPTIELG